MRAHRWPGNLRELRNAVERAVILSPGGLLTPFDLGLSTARRTDQEPSIDHRIRVGAPISLAALEREHLAQVVAPSSSLEAAARMLDIDATTLQRKRKRFGLV